MKLLRIEIKGYPLLKEDGIIDFVASQRVSDADSDKMANIFSNIYQNNVLAFIGINASGKTTILNMISFVLNLMSANQINNIDMRDVLSVLSEKDILDLNIYFYDDGNVNLLSTSIGVDSERSSRRYVILDENLKSKNISKIKYKRIYLILQNLILKFTGIKMRHFFGTISVL